MLFLARLRTGLGQFRRSGATRSALCLAAAVFCCSAAFAPVDAEPRQAPNSRVALDVGESFSPSNRFSGFVDEKSGASFVIVEMPASAYDQVKHIADSTEALTRQGLAEPKKAELAGRKGEYVYFTGKQQNQGNDFAKFVLILRENNATAMVTANIPQKALDAGTFTPAQIEEILAKATVKDEALVAAELFRLGYLGPFKEAFGLMGTSKGYSTSGQPPTPGENRLVMEPMLIVAPSIDSREVPDVKAAAQRSFQSFGGFMDREITSEKPITIASLKGYQIVGTAADQRTGERIGIFLVFLAGDAGGYYALVGTSPAADMEKMLPEFEKVTASFEPVKP